MKGRTHPRCTSLHDAQLVVAREFGFSSWRRLQDAVARKSVDMGEGYRALITGGAGFIGSHLAEILVTRGHHVTIVDDLSVGSRSNVSHLLDDPQCELVIGDICDDQSMDRLVADADVVYHLVATIPQACGEIVNIGTRSEHSLLELADLVKAATRSDSSMTHISYDRLPSGDFHRHIPWKTPNLSKARKLIGYSQVHAIEECLHDIVALDSDPGIA